MSDMMGHNLLRAFQRKYVVDLRSDYYITHDSECNICQEAAVFEDEPCTTIVQIRNCEHFFHEACLGNWLVESITRGRTGTCPICRSVLINNVHDRVDDWGRNAAERRALYNFLHERLLHLTSE